MRRVAWAAVFLAACGDPGDGTSPDPSTATGGSTTTSSTTTSSGGTTAGSTTDTRTSTWFCRSDIADADLNGDYPAAELPPPEFAATNRDGAPRGQADLIGHLTVLWFYPAAGTAG